MTPLLQKMPSKRSSENNSHWPSNFKHRKLEAVRSSPANCVAAAQSDIISPRPNAIYPSDVEHSRVDFARDSPEQCTVHRRESEKPTNEEKYALAIPAVPLRSVLTINVEKGGEEEKMSKDNENKVCSLEESWKHDLAKLAAVIADAQNYLNAFNAKYSASKQILDLDGLVESKGFDQLPSSVCDVLHNCRFVGEPKPLMQTVRQEKGEGEVTLSESDCELTETNVTSLGKTEQNELLEKVTTSDTNGVVVYYDINIKTTGKGNNELKNYDENKKELINLSIVKHEQPQGLKVMKVLKLFEKYYKEIVKEHKMHPRGRRRGTYSHLEAAKRLKKEGKYISPKKSFGHIPGVEIGDEFRFRSQLAVVGLHRQLIASIDHVFLGGKKYATSIVDSGHYENTIKTLDVLIYSGQGGNPKIGDNSVDQNLEKGNLALKNSMEMGYPIRVTYKRKRLMDHEHVVVYVYDGLYMVNNVWQEKEKTGILVFKFELHRISDQPRSHQIDAKSKRIEMSVEEICMMDDISRGKEKIQIRAMNGVDDDSPPQFTYVNHMVHPYWYNQIEPDGCDCVKGCSDSHQCPCVVKNRGEIPFNEKGAIIRRKSIIHECGPSCKCPPTCMNRVGQHGLRYKLEIFKTEKRGWGVRSRDLIPSGGFICEYLGEFLRDNEADLRVGDDEYLFDIYNSRGGHVGFAIDAAMYGSIGRFINHSCSPNLYAQDVLYDHDDKRMPHVMFFATKDITPLQELCYDYNYKLGTVRDADGNVKTKDCYCGSDKCSKRMY